MHKLNIPSENERRQAQAQALVQEKGKILILVPVQALVFLLALRLFSRWNKSCYALFVLALMLSTLMKTRLYRTTNNETSKHIWTDAHNNEPEKNITVFENVQKCRYDSVKILCFRNWRNPGVSFAISLCKRLWYLALCYTEKNLRKVSISKWTASKPTFSAKSIAQVRKN